MTKALPAANLQGPLPFSSLTPGQGKPNPQGPHLPLPQSAPSPACSSPPGSLAGPPPHPQQIWEAVLVGFFQDKAELKNKLGAGKVYNPAIDASERQMRMKGWHRAIKACRTFSESEE